MSVPWWPSWTKPSVYSIHSRSSDKKFVIIWGLLMWESLHFGEDHHQSGSDWFCRVSYETWSNTITLSVHGSFIYHRYQPLISNEYSMVCSITCFCLANYYVLRHQGAWPLAVLINQSLIMDAKSIIVPNVYYKMYTS